MKSTEAMFDCLLNSVGSSNPRHCRLSTKSLLGELCEHLGEFVPLDEVEELLLVCLQDGAAVAQDGARVPPRLEPLEGQPRALRLVQLVLVGRVN